MAEGTARCPACEKPRQPGSTECPHCGIVFARYRARGLPSVMTVADAEGVARIAPRTDPAEPRSTRPPFFSRLSLRQLEGFLVAAGESLAAGITSAAFARGAGGAMLPPELGRRFVSRMDEGGSLVSFLEELGLPGVQDGAILRAAEKRGELPVAIAALAGGVESRRKGRSRLIGQLLYPALLLLAWTLIEPLAVLVLEGPVAYFSRVLPKVVPLVLALSLGPYFAFRMSAQSPLLRWFLIPLSIVPPFSGITLRRAKAAFAEVLGAGLRAGLPLYESLALAGDAAHHRAFLAPLARARDEIQSGARLYVAIAHLPFTREERAWIQHGEESGHLDLALVRVGDRNRDQAKLRTRILFLTAALVFAVFVLARLLMGTVAAYKGYFQLLDGLLEP